MTQTQEEQDIRLRNDCYMRGVISDPHRAARDRATLIRIIDEMRTKERIRLLEEKRLRDIKEHIRDL